MRIQGISTTPFFYNNTRINKNNEKQDYKRDTLQGYYLTPAISFEARVDKGLQRFYEFNIRRMPSTVKNYIETLPDKSLYTPLGAQRNAFSKLLYAKNAEDIKKLYPEEDLFKNIVNPDSSKATRGILGIFRENRELLELCGQGILADNENLTVYLIKKIFLEGKTLDEMNEDLKRDCNPEFLSLYQQKENGMMLRSSTLKALGIEQPESEYLQSLRYTRDGYSDLVGEKISQVQRAFWESMPPEERTARARKSVERFESWWNSLTRDQQLDKIAAQVDELTLLEEFNKSDFGKTKKQTPAKPIITQTSPAHPGTGITSSLSRDDLFKIWAANNLKLFMANLSEFDKKAIETKRTQNAALRWEQMSAEEKTEYISRIKSGSEPLRYAMIDAWNNNPDIIVQMSVFLKKQQVKKPVDSLYSDELLSSFMSEVMTKFWEEYPDFALKLGNSIKESHLKIKNSINSGHFSDLKSKILKDKKNRLKDVEQMIKEYNEININYDGFRPIAKEFADIYQENNADLIKLLPNEYLQDFFDTANKYLSDEQLSSWIKFIKDDDIITIQDIDNINTIKAFEPPEAKIMNRALEAAISDILYLCTNNPEVFLMSQADAKVALLQIDRGSKKIGLFSHNNDRKFEMPVLSQEIDTNLIKKLYHWYKKPLNNNDMNSIVEQFFSIHRPPQADGKKQKPMNERQLDSLRLLCEYIYSYGHSIFIPFSNANYPPEVKAAFMQKFINHMPQNIIRDTFDINVSTLEDFKKEAVINTINNLIKRRYNFLPNNISELYNLELDKMLRIVSMDTVNDFKRITADYKSYSDDTFVKSIRFKREIFNNISILHFLCAEQTIADALYKATGEPKVYALTLEELIDTVESFQPIDRTISKTKEIESSILGEKFNLKLKNKLNFYKSGTVFEDYIQELVDYLKEMENPGSKPDKTELLYILNPEESQKEIDNYTMKRIEFAENYF